VHSQVAAGDQSRREADAGAREQPVQSAVLAARADVVRVPDLVADLPADQDARRPAREAAEDRVQRLLPVAAGEHDLLRRDRHTPRIHGRGGRRHGNAGAGRQQGEQRQDGARGNDHPVNVAGITQGRHPHSHFETVSPGFGRL